MSQPLSLAKIQTTSLVICMMLSKRETSLRGLCMRRSLIHLKQRNITQTSSMPPSSSQKRISLFSPSERSLSIGILPSINQPPIVKAKQYEQPASHEEWIGTVIEFESHVTDEDFVQPTTLAPDNVREFKARVRSRTLPLL
jgi:hypothetical protein